MGKNIQLNKKLAIVIPAYKIEFFEDTLKSFSHQTCKDFTVYIGDDCSKDDFRSLVDRYRDCIDIVYHRFESNLGGQDLVAHWKRCIELTQDEPWLWLFSDDDCLDNNCVESFFKELRSTDNPFDIYHFNVDIINQVGVVLRKTTSYPDIILCDDFYRKKELGKINSFVVEYIFSREIYKKVDGFQSFDLAWGSDIATWIKIGYEKGIKTISNARVQWRQSDKNITPNVNNKMLERKLQANLNFLQWSNSFFCSKKMRLFNMFLVWVYVFHYSKWVNNKDMRDFINKAKVMDIITDIISVLYKMSLPIVSCYKNGFNTK